MNKIKYFVIANTVMENKSVAFAIESLTVKDDLFLQEPFSFERNHFWKFRCDKNNLQKQDIQSWICTRKFTQYCNNLTVGSWFCYSSSI